MSYPRVQFVSAPSLDADVRFDCNSVGEWSDDDRWPEHDGFTLGFPSLAGDPEAIGVQYGTREIEFNLIVRATPDAAFSAFSRLSREVQRDRNWLMVQFSDFSKPVWFYTYRTEQQALDFANVSGVDDKKRSVWGIGVRLAADPFARGEAITLGPFTVNNHDYGPTPFAYHVSLPDIVGDAPAPVRMRVETSTDWSGFKPMFSSIALDGGDYDGTPIQYSFKDAGTGIDANPWATSTAYPAQGYIPVDFATDNSLINRVADHDTVLPVGTYRVMVWVARSSTNATFRLRGRHTRGSVDILGDSVDFDRSASATGGHGMWVDLGLFTFPAFLTMTDQDVVYGQPTEFKVQAQRLSGTGSLNMSALLYVPVETPWSVESRSQTAEFGGSGLPTTDRSGVWDEDGNYRMLITSSLPRRSIYDATPPKPTGSPVTVVPGCANTVTVLQQTNCHTPGNPADDNRDVVGATSTVTLSYAPRYFHLAGSEQL